MPEEGALQAAEDLLQSQVFTSQPELPLSRGDSPFMDKISPMQLLLALWGKGPFLQLHIAFF